MPVWALDDDALAGEPTVRLAGAGDGARDGARAAGRLVLAAGPRVVAELFGELVPGVGVSERTRRMRLVALAVHGVPQLTVHEALDRARTILLEG
ncbi:MAG: hypothetical protein M3296_06775 [Actinomycetota bacterium]|nr:hypothetical protein [Actinomycetota bacterium]